MIQSAQRHVLITGCSTGIGRASALRLAQAGFGVIATVRNDADAASITNAGASTPGGIRAILLDVSDPDAVNRAAQQVAECVGENGLYALINNAGICVVGPVECVTLENWRRQFDVILFGAIATIKAMLPLLRLYNQAHGKPQARIITINSTTGEVATPVFAAYSACKYALKAMTECLRLELRAQGIHVSSIFPGTVQSEIWRKEKEGMREVAALPLAQRYYTTLIANVSQVVFEDAKGAMPADTIAKIIERALQTPKPKPRYYTGWAAQLGSWATRIIPHRIFESLLARSLKVPPAPKS